MSPRAAWRLESSGFDAVFDYTAGKADWMAAGLPVSGTRPKVLQAGDVADRDVPTCDLLEQVGDVAARTRTRQLHTAVVVNDRRVVLGVLHSAELDRDPELTVEEAMRPGPTTIRADIEVAEIVDRLQARGVASIVVTDPDGRLIGLLDREHARQRVAATDPTKVAAAPPER